MQAGKLSEEEAMVIAEKLGLMSAPAIERTASLSKATQLYNFSVLKWSKGGSVQRLILQVYICLCVCVCDSTTPVPLNGLYFSGWLSMDFGNR